MNRTSPQEFKRISEDLYKNITPKRIRTLSQNMQERCKPFENLENSPKCSTLKIYKNNSLNSKKQLPHNASAEQGQGKHFNVKNDAELNFMKSNEEAECSQMIKKDIEKLKRCEKPRADQLMASNVNQGGEKLIVEGSATQIETCNYRDISQTTGYCSDESTNKTSSFLDGEISIANLINCEQPLKNSTLIHPEDRSILENNSLSEIANNSQDPSLQDHKAKECNPISNSNNKNSTCHSCSQIPLIIINEIDVVGKPVEKKEIKITKYETLKVPAHPKPPKYEGNKELQKKIAQKEFYKQMKVKDQVLAQLLKMARSSAFPILKHVCNIGCHNTSGMSCKKANQQMYNAVSHQSDRGIFRYVWRTIKYPFASNSPVVVEKVVGPMEDKENYENSYKEAGNSKGKNKVGKKQHQPNGIENLKRENCFDYIVRQERKRNAENLKSPRDLMPIRKNTENHEKHNAEHNKDLINLTKDLNKNEGHATKTAVLRNNQRKLSRQISIYNNEDINDVFELDNEIVAKNEKDTKTDLKNKNPNPQKNFVEQIKSKRRFPYFLRKPSKYVKEKLKAEQAVKENCKETLNSIESMEEKFQEIVIAESKISKDTLEKLDNFVATKNKK